MTGQSFGEVSGAYVYREADPAKPWLFAVGGAGLLGAIFSGVSTADFIEHLDRQVHSIHCSFLPGAGESLGESGCRTVMMSPFSSVLRASMWGGLPISLLSLAVFSYLAYRAFDFALRKDRSKKETQFLLLATLLPVLMSVIYGYVSAVKLDAVCKLCAGVYFASAAAFVSALVANGKAEAAAGYDSPLPRWAQWFGEGVLFVGVLVALYLLMAPVNAKSLEGCGTLVKSDDASGVVFPIAGSTGGAPSIAVLDPLCPACKGFDERLRASGLLDRLNMKAVLFPLDASCNWMVKSSLHPGACAVSEAMLCDKDAAPQVLAWAFQNQEALKASAEKSDQPVRDRLLAQFPKLRGCLGSPTIKNKLNKSLRWAVANGIPVLTPQLFIGDRRVCDEDTDLGLEYTVTAMLAQGGGKARK